MDNGHAGPERPPPHPLLALTWMWPGEPRYDEFSRFRPDEGLLVFSQLTLSDCARMARLRVAQRGSAIIVPVSAAPYPGGRFTEEAFRTIIASRTAVARQRMLLRQYRPALTPQVGPAP